MSKTRKRKSMLAESSLGSRLHLLGYASSKRPRKILPRRNMNGEVKVIKIADPKKVKEYRAKKED